MNAPDEQPRDPPRGPLPPGDSQFSLKALFWFITGACCLLAVLSLLGVGGWQLLIGVAVIAGSSALLIALINACDRRR